MPRTTRPVMPRTGRRLQRLGERLRLARLRRGIPLVEMAARVGVSRTTYRNLEAGDPRVSVSLLARALTALGFEDDIDHLAAVDEVGRRIEDIRLPSRPRRRSRASPS